MGRETLHEQVERLSQCSGTSYRIMLAGLFACHGREPVVKAMAASWADKGAVSIATAPAWCLPSAKDNDSKPCPPRPAA